MLSRGFDVPELQFVINVDVPRETDEKKNIKPGYDSYMHRAGRAGRFAQKGVCLTLFDNDLDEKLYFDIVKAQNLDATELTDAKMLDAELSAIKLVQK